MKIRLGLLREYLYEAMLSCPASTTSAPTDDDATVPGHLPNELPKSAAIEEEAWPSGRWLPAEGEPLDPTDVDRVGDPNGLNSADMDETDDRMVDDGKGNGIPDPAQEDDLADHLRNDSKTSLGSPPVEDPEKGFYGESIEVASWMVRELRNFMLQESPPGAGMVDPRDPKGFYSDYDAEKDHGSVEKMQGMYYKSPGQEPGTNGDPFRVEDPATRLGQHSPIGPKDSTTHPAVSGEEGNDARKTPPIWSLNAGSNTGEVLGTTNANTGGHGVESEDEDEGPEEGEEGDFDADGEPVEAEGREQG